MRYMLLVYTNEQATEAASPEQQEKTMAGHGAVMAETRERGILRGAEPLEPTRTATTVRVQNGKVLITDGPFAETKEQLAGYYLVEAANLDQAIAIAEKNPVAPHGSIEVRPIRKLQ